MKNKRIDNMSKFMSKRHDFFTENFTIFECRKNCKRAGI